jgi:hypothetical protein
MTILSQGWLFGEKLRVGLGVGVVVVAWIAKVAKMGAVSKEKVNI